MPSPQLKVVIVEDESHSREALKNLLLDYCPQVEIVALAHSVDSGVEAIQAHDPDLVFLDIEMDQGTGFDLLEQLQALNFQVIFTTAHANYAIKAIKFSALDYLLKPIDVDELSAAVLKVQEIKEKALHNKQLEVLLDNVQPSNQRPTKITLSTAEDYQFINVDEIIYCEADGSYTKFHLAGNRQLMVSKNLKEYEGLLSDHDFFRAHHSFLINLSQVDKYIKSDGGYIQMKNGDAVSISGSKKEQFMQLMSR